MFVPASAQRLARIQSGSFKPACCRFLRSVIQLALGAGRQGTLRKRAPGRVCTCGYSLTFAGM